MSDEKELVILGTRLDIKCPCGEELALFVDNYGVFGSCTACGRKFFGLVHYELYSTIEKDLPESIHTRSSKA